MKENRAPPEMPVPPVADVLTMGTGATPTSKSPATEAMMVARLLEDASMAAVRPLVNSSVTPDVMGL